MSYPLKYRDNSHNKYIIDIEEIEDDSDGKVVLARIKQEENIVARIKLFFDYSWTQKWAKTPEGFRNILFSIDSWSPLIADAIRDFIFGKNLDDLNGREIVFDRSSSQARKVKKHGDGLLYYERSEQIYAEEMDFVEEIVLKEMFRLHAHGPTIERHLIEICHFDEIAIRNAIAICKDKGLIHDTDSGNIRLTSNGISEYKKKLGQKQMKNKTVESESTDQQMEESMSSIKIFISHSEKDMKIAQLLLNVLENSFVIPENAIRCTSVPGYKLPTGAHTSSTLKKELSKTELVVGILTSHSLRSEYVFFELGAGWGMEKWTVALLGSDVDFKNIPGPLKEHYAISLINNSSLFQLIEEISEKLDYEIRSLSKSSSSIEKLVDFVKSSAIDENIVDKEVDKQLEILQKFKLKYETFLRGFEAEWVAVRDSEPDNISDGKYLIDGAFTDIIEFSSQIVLDVETGLKEIFDEAAKRLKKLEKQKLKIDGGRSYAKFWKEGNEIIELLKEIPIAIDEHIRMLNP